MHPQSNLLSARFLTCSTIVRQWRIYRRNFFRTATSSTFNSCSHSRIEIHPSDFRSRTAVRSRFRLPTIFSSQNERLLAGIDRHFVQPCQKQPSKKTATRFPRKTTSGLPGRSFPLSVHPRIDDLTRRDRNLLSVDFVPLDRLRLMTRVLASLSRLSISVSLRAGLPV
jgi:hypothetical protein